MSYSPTNIRFETLTPYETVDNVISGGETSSTITLSLKLRNHIGRICKRRRTKYQTRAHVMTTSVSKDPTSHTSDITVILSKSMNSCRMAPPIAAPIPPTINTSVTAIWVRNDDTPHGAA